MNKLLNGLIIIAATLLIIFISSWYYFCPLFYNLPKPTGNYSVGIMTYHWIDSQKTIDKFSEFNVNIFYPTDSNSPKKFPYQPDKIEALKTIKPQNSYLPAFVWNCLLSGVYTYAQPNAPLSDKETNYPVIIYLPGIAGDDLHNVYLEQLASHGYVVFAIEPPGDTTVTVFPKNKIIPVDANLKKAIETNNRTEIYNYRNQAHERWNAYIGYTINKLQQLNVDKESIFYQKLNLGQLGLLGHSHGGAVVTDFCQKNNRCKAGINMDGWTKTYNSDQSFDTPFLFLLNEQGGMPEMENFFSNNNRSNFHKVVIHGAGHAAFNDYLLIKQPIARWFGIATKNNFEIRDQICKEIISFFDRYLKINEITFDKSFSNIVHSHLPVQTQEQMARCSIIVH